MERRGAIPLGLIQVCVECGLVQQTPGCGRDTNDSLDVPSSSGLNQRRRLLQLAAIEDRVGVLPDDLRTFEVHDPVNRVCMLGSGPITGDLRTVHDMVNPC